MSAVRLLSASLHLALRVRWAHANRSRRFSLSLWSIPPINFYLYRSCWTQLSASEIFLHWNNCCPCILYGDWPLSVGIWEFERGSVLTHADDDIEVTVLDVKGNQARIGIDAPQEITTHCEEVCQVDQGGDRVNWKHLHNQPGSWVGFFVPWAWWMSIPKRQYSACAQLFSTNVPRFYNSVKNPYFWYFTDFAIE